MKFVIRFSILLLFVLSLSALSAQPVLNSASHFPQVGDTILRVRLEPDTLHPGPSGSNVIWNFSQLHTNLQADSVAVLQTLGMPIFSHNAVFSVFGTGMIYNDYYWASGDSLCYVMQDHNIPDLDPVQFINNQVLLRFPVNYGDHLTDVFSGEHQTIAGPVNFSGNTTVDVDAFGTLILPGGSYSDVLRIHQHDTIVVFGQPIAFDTYYFYAASLRYPLLVIGQNTYLRGSFVETYYPGAIVTARPDAQAGLDVQLSPNPFEETLTLRAPGPGELRIVGLDGREYSKTLIRQGFSENKIMLGGLPAGMYVATYTCGQGSWQQRIVKQ
jgi:hypothetical protein